MGLVHEVRSAEEIKIIVFGLNDQEYGVEVTKVKSIERLENITRVPRTPKFVKGIINLRGTVTPIIDLKERLDIEGTDGTEHSRIIIISLGDIEVGLIVDSAYDVIDVPAQSIQPPPVIIGGVRSEYIRGIAKLEQRLLVLLNLDRILSAEELNQLSAAEGIGR